MQFHRVHDDPGDPRNPMAQSAFSRIAGLLSVSLCMGESPSDGSGASLLRRVSTQILENSDCIIIRFGRKGRFYTCWCRCGGQLAPRRPIPVPPHRVRASLAWHDVKASISAWLPPALWGPSVLV
eukprot:3004826-Alexandrium_andersonii.AAC.1